MRISRTVPAVVLILALAAPAQAAQLDPRTAPITSGPLIEDSDTYEGKRCSRNEMMDLENKVVVAVTKYCWTFFRFDPAAETDTARNYGAWWIQSIVRPKNGWCTSKVVTQMSMSTGSTMHGISGKDFETSSKRDITPKLRLDVEGNTETPALIKQSLKLIPKKLVTKFVSKNNNFKMVWTGATRRAVAAAGGIEGSWPAEESPPVFLPGMSPRVVSDC